MLALCTALKLAKTLILLSTASYRSRCAMREARMILRKVARSMAHSSPAESACSVQGHDRLFNAYSQLARALLREWKHELRQGLGHACTEAALGQLYISASSPKAPFPS